MSENNRKSILLSKYQSMNRKELITETKRFGITGCSKLNKSDLIKNLVAYELNNYLETDEDDSEVDDEAEESKEQLETCVEKKELTTETKNQPETEEIQRKFMGSTSYSSQDDSSLGTPAHSSLACASSTLSTSSSVSAREGKSTDKTSKSQSEKDREAECERICMLREADCDRGCMLRKADCDRICILIETERERRCMLIETDWKCKYMLRESELMRRETEYIKLNKEMMVCGKDTDSDSDIDSNSDIEMVMKETEKEVGEPKNLTKTDVVMCCCSFFVFLFLLIIFLLMIWLSSSFPLLLSYIDIIRSFFPSPTSNNISLMLT